MQCRDGFTVFACNSHPLRGNLNPFKQSFQATPVAFPTLLTALCLPPTSDRMPWRSMRPAAGLVYHGFFAPRIWGLVLVSFCLFRQSGPCRWPLWNDADFMSKLRSLIQQVRRNGLSGLIELIQLNLSRVDACVRLQLDLTRWRPPEQFPCPEGFELRYLGLHEFDSARGSASVSLPQDFFEDRIHGLTQAFGGFVKGQLVHILWLSVHGERSTVPGFILGSKEVEMRNVTTLKAFRGRGILNYAVTKAALDLRQRGVERIFVHVEEDNIPSLRGFRNAGFQTTHRVIIRRVLGFDRVRVEPTPVLTAGSPP